jgi:type II secretory pathway component PulF
VSDAAIAKRVAEGEAKGASEAQILVAANRVKTDMEVTQEAMLAAGRAKPSADETERGAMLMARGVTAAQIEAMARRTPSNRSLVVAFDVVSQLATQGVPVTQALARVQAKIDSRASDAALLKLAGSATTGVGAGVSTAAPPGAAAGATVQGAANAAARGTTTGVAGTVAGTVTGVVKKP